MLLFLLVLLSGYFDFMPYTTRLLNQTRGWQVQISHRVCVQPSMRVSNEADGACMDGGWGAEAKKERKHARKVLFLHVRPRLGAPVTK